MIKKRIETNEKKTSIEIIETKVSKEAKWIENNQKYTESKENKN